MPPSFGPDWQRIKKWCLLGTLAMLVWLLVPTARCSWHAYQATPLSELDENAAAPSQTDAQRLAEGQGFFEKMTGAVKGCYAQTPLLGQESWKSTLLFVLAGGYVLAWALHRHELSRKKTYG